jgi:hypothetical protein
MEENKIRVAVPIWGGGGYGIWRLAKSRLQHARILYWGADSSMNRKDILKDAAHRIDPAQRFREWEKAQKLTTTLGRSMACS